MLVNLYIEDYWGPGASASVEDIICKLWYLETREYCLRDERKRIRWRIVIGKTRRLKKIGKDIRKIQDERRQICDKLTKSKIKIQKLEEDSLPPEDFEVLSPLEQELRAFANTPLIVREQLYGNRRRKLPQAVK